MTALSDQRWTFWPNPSVWANNINEESFNWRFIFRVSAPAYLTIIGLLWIPFIHNWTACDLKIILLSILMHLAFALLIINGGVERLRKLRIRFAHFFNASLALSLPLSTSKAILGLWLFFMIAVWIDAYYCPRSWFSLLINLLLPWVDPLWNWNSPNVNEKVINLAMITAFILVIFILSTYNGISAHKTNQDLMEQKVQGEVTSERDRIGRILHGTLGSALSEIALWQDVALSSPDKQEGSLLRAQARARAALADLRTVVADLDIRGTTTLNAVADGIRKHTQGLCEAAQVEFKLNLQNEVSLNQAHGYHIAKIAIEAITNAIRHGRPTSISVSLAVLPLEIRVEDNGVGFVPETMTRGQGLDNLSQHVTALGASLKINSAPGKGTCIVIKARDNA